MCGAATQQHSNNKGHPDTVGGNADETNRGQRASIGVGTGFPCSDRDRPFTVYARSTGLFWVVRGRSAEGRSKRGFHGPGE